MRYVVMAFLLFFLLDVAAGYVVASNVGDLARGYFDSVAAAIERVNHG